MRSLRKVYRILCCVGLAWCVWALPRANGAAEEPATTPKLWAADEMRWEEDKRLPGVKSVLLWGNPLTGEHGMLRRFPAGFVPPLHTHPSVERLVVISGTVVVSYVGSTEKSLGPGFLLGDSCQHGALGEVRNGSRVRICTDVFRTFRD